MLPVYRRSNHAWILCSECLLDLMRLLTILHDLYMPCSPVCGPLAVATVLTNINDEITHPDCTISTQGILMPRLTRLVMAGEHGTRLQPPS